MGLAALIAGQSMVFSFAVNIDPVSGVERWMLHGLLAVAAVAVFVLVGGPLVTTSLREARRGRWVVEQFFLVGTVGAFAASAFSSLSGVGAVYYEVVAVLVAIYSLGKIVGDRRRQQALDAVSSLRREFERCLRVTCCGAECEVPVNEIKPGDRVRVLAGAGLPVDGWVRDGTALVAETPLNGEAFPVVRRPGDRVWAGSHVVDADLLVEVSHKPGERQLDRLLAGVESARSRPSRLQREADRIVGWFLPLVLTLSVLTTLGWGLRAGWTVGLFNGLAVLVVACPCAMGLATPIAVWSALNRLARRGVVPQSGEFLERLAQVDTVVFDKTGTLTEEHLEVVDWVEAPGVDRSELEAQIGAVQRSQAHPVARAFRSFAFDSSRWKAGALALIPGEGIAATVTAADGHDVHRLELGNESMGLRAGRAWEELRGHLRGAPLATRTVAVRRDGVLVAAAALRENVRASAEGVIRAFISAGLEVRIMSGDRAEHVQALSLCAVDGASGMTPEAKAEAVRALQAGGRRVLFVGDGINDAPAMAAAHASVALSSGAPLSRESSGAQLFGSDLSAITEAVAVAGSTVRGVRLNLYLAAAYNLVGIALAMAGLINPILAVLLMLASSFTVSFRALRLAEGAPVLRKENAAARKNIVTALPSLLKSEGLAALVMVGVLAQGILLAELAALPLFPAWVLVGVFGLLAIGVWKVRHSWTTYPYRASFLGMLTLGNLGMVLGWWADADWAPAIRDGVCLCGCQKSHFGAGLLGGLGWMHVGMLAGSIPGIYWEQKLRGGSGGDGAQARWLICLAFMWLGMQLGAWAVVGWFVGEPRLQLLASYTAMTLGMTAGMLIICGPRMWAETRKPQASP
jgi:heavy metal translocating P-type ATPase